MERFDMENIFILLYISGNVVFVNLIYIYFLKIIFIELFSWQNEELKYSKYISYDLSLNSYFYFAIILL